VLGAFSGFVLLATAAAGVVLFLHPKGDRLVRGVAVAVQGVGQLVLFRWIEASYNGDEVQKDIERLYQAHLTFHANPVTFGREVLTHLQHIAQIYPGGSGVWLTVGALAAIVGLVVAAFGRGGIGERIWARYLGLMLVVSFVGALDGKFPFGPTVEHLLSVGGRYMLWVTPVMAFGLAAVLHRVYRLACRLPAGRWIVDVAAGVAILAVLFAGVSDARPYPSSGSATAARYFDSMLRPGDVGIIVEPSIYSFADATDLPVSLQPTPNRMIGFTPHYPGHHIYSLGPDGSAPFNKQEIQRVSRGAQRVVVMTIAGDFAGTLPKQVTKSLNEIGFDGTQHRWRGQYVIVFTPHSRS
jgi:hypothetical protein